MLDKRQIRAMFLFEFKMSCNRDNSQYHNAFGQGTANKHTVQWWFKKFCRGDESLEVEEHSDQPSEVDNDRLRGSLKLILVQLQLHEKLPKNSTLTILPSFSIWSKLERLKSSISGYLVSWLLIKKNCHFEVSSLFLHSEPFLSLWCAMKSGFYTTAQGWPAQWLDQEEVPKHYPKPDLHQKKGHSHCFMVTVWCSAAGLIHYNFLIPSEKITTRIMLSKINEIHWKLQGLQLVLFYRMDSVLHDAACLNSSHTTNTSEVEQIGLQSFASSAIFTWPFANQLPLLQASRQLFAG